ncbi:uncharacterized protein YegP (UPF0339 family) [Arthrobacter sp. UYCu512]|uniref:YegP family protein n=1 Tax=Arthrobacter sp. UYCu512 TaxID=3156338 RepID=UPI003396C67D
MAVKYAVYQDRSGGYRFRLGAANGETIASSESYTTKAAALGGIDSVQKNGDSQVTDLTQ